MEKLQKSNLEQILGIYSPFSIRSLDVNPTDESLLIVLEEPQHKSRFSLRARNTARPESQQGKLHTRKWQHIRVGRFTTHIQVEVGDKLKTEKYSFLGDPTKQYTYALQQSIEQAASKGLDAETISSLLGYDMVTIRAILMDIEASENERKADAILPLESDPIWRAILTHEVNLTTKLLPLKLLLSRLKLNVYNNKDSDSIQASVAELRQFFAQHAHQLKGEFAQLGINAPVEESKPKQTAKLRLKLPGLNNPIWHQILSGNFDLHSRNMPLNLYITKLKKQYSEISDTTERRDIIAELQAFFKKSARTLVPELKILTKIITGEADQQASVSLPSEDSQIWSLLLNNETSLPTTKMNYLLLLSKLRSSLLNNDNETALSDARKQLREFFLQNQHVLEQEIKHINDLAVAI